MSHTYAKIHSLSLRYILVAFFFEKEDDPRPLHLGDAYGHFINDSHKTLQSHTTVRLKPPSKQTNCRYTYPVDEGAQIASA